MNIREKNIDFLKSLIGMDKDSGSKLCEKMGYIVRIVREDSNGYMLTMDFRFDRIDLEIDGGLITKSSIG
jgi:hypothetical protein